MREPAPDDCTAADLARTWKVSPRTIARWVARDRVPTVVSATGHRRFRREDAEEIARRMHDAH